MALIGNRSVLLKSPGRYFGGSTVSDNRSNFGTPGSSRGRFVGAFPQSAATPRGYRPPYAWITAIKNGEMASVNEAAISIGATGDAKMGVNLSGSADLAITTSDLIGQLISSGSGSASFALTTNSPLLTASINGSGAASFVVQTNTPLLGAIADGSGTALFSMTAMATILPTNDASPLRTGVASFSFGGTLTPYAIGHMSGTTEEAGLTPNGIANSVWGKVIEAGFSADQILRILAAQAAGSATGLEGSNPQFTGLDGTTVRIDGNYVSGTRTIDVLNGD